MENSSKGYPRYCEAQTLADGTTILNGGRSRRGKLRGPPGSRDLQVSYLISSIVGMQLVSVLATNHPISLNALTERKFFGVQGLAPLLQKEKGSQ